MGTKYWLNSEDFIAQKKGNISKEGKKNKKSLYKANPEKTGHVEDVEPGLGYILDPTEGKISKDG